MGRTSTLSIKEDYESLKGNYKQVKAAHLRLRVKSLVLFKSGKFKAQQAIAYRLGIDASTLGRWFKVYKSLGLEALLENRFKGNRPRAISPDIHEGLAKKVHCSTAPFQSHRQAVSWVKDTYGQEVNYNTLRNHLMRHFKTKIKQPRKSHYKKDEQLVGDFKKTCLVPSNKSGKA